MEEATLHPQVQANDFPAHLLWERFSSDQDAHREPRPTETHTTNIHEAPSSTASKRNLQDLENLSFWELNVVSIITRIYILNVLWTCPLFYLHVYVNTCRESDTVIYSTKTWCTGWAVAFQTNITETPHANSDRQMRTWRPAVAVLQLWDAGRLFAPVDEWDKPKQRMQ